MNYVGIFAACIGVPALILSIAFLAYIAAKADDRCPCDWCQRERDRVDILEGKLDDLASQITAEGTSIREGQ